ncbi:splicing factor 3B subunit 1-like, partial [Notothenia coriiceps]|uniref:Splicing factor 3B subunit 1-like n=1 Tax=Notothenia coriiceps TaxID=8208 RepID=A0A6I9NLV2_9TELE
ILVVIEPLLIDEDYYARVEGREIISNLAKFNRRSPSAQLVDTTVELANKVGAAEIISRIVDDLKDEAEQYRKMVMETIEKIMGNLGAADIDHKLEEQLIDGILYAFQEQTTEDSVMLNGFGTVVNALGKRVKPYLPQICGTVLWRLNNKSAKVRQQAADLISRTAVVMKTCQEVGYETHRSKRQLYFIFYYLFKFFYNLEFIHPKNKQNE